MSQIKRTILKQFRKEIGIPDNDKIGNEELVKWGLEGNVTYIEMKGGVLIGDNYKKIKDCDDAIKYFDEMNEVFMQFVESKERKEILQF